MPAFNDTIQINRGNYSRSNTTIELSVNGLATDISQFVQGITYSDSLEKEFGFSLTTVRPNRFGVGNYVGEGTLTLDDEGLDTLNSLSIGGDYQDLGIGTQMDITVSYTTQDDRIKEDILREVHFTVYNNGVNSSDILYDREITMMIGKVEKGRIV